MKLSATNPAAAERRHFREITVKIIKGLLAVAVVMGVASCAGSAGAANKSKCPAQDASGAVVALAKAEHYAAGCLSRAATVLGLEGSPSDVVVLEEFVFGVIGNKREQRSFDAMVQSIIAIGRISRRAARNEQQRLRKLLVDGTTTEFWSKAPIRWQLAPEKQQYNISHARLMFAVAATYDPSEQLLENLHAIRDAGRYAEFGRQGERVIPKCIEAIEEHLPGGSP